MCNCPSNYSCSSVLLKRAIEMNGFCDSSKLCFKFRIDDSFDMPRLVLAFMDLDVDLWRLVLCF